MFFQVNILIDLSNYKYKVCIIPLGLQILPVKDVPNHYFIWQVLASNLPQRQFDQTMFTMYYVYHVSCSVLLGMTKGIK